MLTLLSSILEVFWRIIVSEKSLHLLCCIGCRLVTPYSDIHADNLVQVMACRLFGAISQSIVTVILANKLWWNLNQITSEKKIIWERRLHNTEFIFSTPIYKTDQTDVIDVLWIRSPVCSLRHHITRILVCTAIHNGDWNCRIKSVNILLQTTTI